METHNFDPGDLLYILNTLAAFEQVTRLNGDHLNAAKWGQLHVVANSTANFSVLQLHVKIEKASEKSEALAPSRKEISSRQVYIDAYDDVIAKTKIKMLNSEEPSAMTSNQYGPVLQKNALGAIKCIRSTLSKMSSWKDCWTQFVAIRFHTEGLT